MMGSKFFQFFSGGIMVGSWTIALLFLKSWKKTSDRLFLFFCLAFFLFGMERLTLAFFDVAEETRFYIYLHRLVGFLLIVYAVIDKNRRNYGKGVHS